MNRIELLEKQKRLEKLGLGVCGTCRCPVCGDNSISFDDKEELTGAKCYKCGKVNDDDIEFCGCEV